MLNPDIMNNLWNEPYFLCDEDGPGILWVHAPPSSFLVCDIQMFLFATKLQFVMMSKCGSLTNSGLFLVY